MMDERPYIDERAKIVAAGGPTPHGWYTGVDWHHDNISKSLDRLGVSDCVARVDMHTRFTRLVELDVMLYDLFSNVWHETGLPVFNFSSTYQAHYQSRRIYFRLAFSPITDLIPIAIKADKPRARRLRSELKNYADGAMLELGLDELINIDSVNYVIVAKTEAAMWAFLPKLMACVRSAEELKTSTISELQKIVPMSMIGRTRYAIIS